ncbi:MULTISPECIES: CHAP domain-containing protein [unclassified Streptomyces]|uniref:CHAP domain-containing protein n=1 Tax=unclassified Streptomyces TaxID=2593676 RepID=UPI0033FCEDBE
MSVTAADVIKVAKAEVGTHETQSGGHWVNDSKYNRWFGRIPGYDRDGYGYPWCAAFVAWCADKAGAASLYPKTAGCEVAVEWFKRAKRFSEYPAVGAQVFYGPGGGTHTGIVYDYDEDPSGYIYTIEGNTNLDGSAEGDGVYLRKRLRRSDNVYGYGYPKFADGIKSADPAWKSETPKPAPTKPTPVPPRPATPTVSLANVVAAARRDPGLKQGGTTHPADVRIVEAALVAEGMLARSYAADGSFGSLTVEAYKGWQRSLGYRGSDADGIPGLTSLTRLGDRHGFKVRA